MVASYTTDPTGMQCCLDVILIAVYRSRRRPNINPLPAKLFNFNFHPLEVTSGQWKLFRFDKMVVNSLQILLVDVTFYL